MTDGADRERRAGRGRLSSLDLLPEEAQEDVTWARVELAKRDRTQAEILSDFNGRLVDKGIEPVSKSAFNRASIRLAAMNTRLSEARAIFEGVAPQFTAEKVDEQTVVLGEFIKLLIFDLVQEDGTAIGTKGAMELASAHLAVIRGQAVSADRRRKLEADFKAEALKAVDRVAKETGMSDDLRRNINAELFGVAPPAPRARA